MNNLTGKCKADFEKYISADDDGEKYRYGQNISTNFLDFPFSMQWGVYQDFFMHHDIVLYAFREDVEDIHNNIKYKFKHYHAWVNDVLLNDLEGINQARTAAIEKANEIYNQQSKES